jgi:hypothetical protein
MSWEGEEEEEEEEEEGGALILRLPHTSECIPTATLSGARVRAEGGGRVGGGGALHRGTIEPVRGPVRRAGLGVTLKVQGGESGGAALENEETMGGGGGTATTGDGEEGAGAGAGAGEEVGGGGGTSNLPMVQSTPYRGPVPWMEASN